MRAIFLIISVIFALSTYAFATPEYSQRTGMGCMTCHIRPEGGVLSERGLEFAASGYKWPPEGGYRVLGPLRKSVRLILGLMHIVGGFLWFGTILYVHILLRPAYAAKGLPKGEMALGLISMGVVGVTGLLLTISRIKSISILWDSPWGILLLVKIFFYIVMVISAIIVVSIIGPRLKRAKITPEHPKSGIFDPVTLSGFNGKDAPAYIAFKGIVYDVSGLRHWKDGLHMKHRAGEDLTAALSKAPHGEEKLSTLRQVGRFDASLKPPLRAEQKAFYFIAYMNLGLVFLVLIVLSLWRWGL